MLVSFVIISIKEKHLITKKKNKNKINNVQNIFLFRKIQCWVYMIYIIIKILKPIKFKYLNENKKFEPEIS